jgi:hypothetical protein
MRGIHLFFFAALTIFITSLAAQATETQLVHIRVSGMELTKSLRVPDADYDISAITDRSGIVEFRFAGKNADNWYLDMHIPVNEIRGAEKSFVKSKLPGAPYCFSATGAKDFSADKGGVIRFHALSDWKWMVFKKYGYKDFDLQIDYEAGNVRASLVKGNKSERIQKLTVDVGLIGASIKTE